MLKALETDARQLAEYMSELSEDAYYAGWISGLEYELWNALINGPREYGRLQITSEHIGRLRELAAAAAGWIVFDDVEEETLIPIAEWEKRFAEWERHGRREPR